MSNFIQEQNLEREDQEENGKFERKITIRTIFCSKLSKGVIFLAIFAIACPVLIYYWVINRGVYVQEEFHTCLVQTTYRIPCGRANITREDCAKIECCFDNSEKLCYHYLPSKYYYKYKDTFNQYISSQRTTPFGNETKDSLQITLQEKNGNQVSIVLHEKSQSVEGIERDKKNYKVNIDPDKLVVRVHRDEDIILTTGEGPLIYSEHYWEWSIFLTNETLFGLGQTVIQLNDNSTLTKVIYKNQNDHSTLPVFWAYKNKKFHGVAIKHDGPLEITILPSYVVILKGLIGGSIELEVSVGPTPQDLHKQQMGEFILPPYWLMGTHMCRRSSTTDLATVLKEYNENAVDLVYDSECIHENLLMAIAKNEDSTILQEFQDALQKLVESGKKFVLSVPPHIYANATDPLYTAAQNLSILYQNGSATYKGKYLDQDVAYPDYTSPQINDFVEAFDKYIEGTIGTGNITGLVLEDNWPVDESFQLTDNSSFPYFSEDLKNAMSETLPWFLNLTNGSEEKHIKYHNAYGSEQNSSFYRYYATTKYSSLLIMSSVKSYGENEPDVVENVDASWENLRMTLGNVLFNSIIGNHLVSVPICGDTDSYDKSSQETLCIRWYLLAATMPIFRISSYKPYRNPANLNSKFAENVGDKAISHRNNLKAYYYTILSRGEPVVRPMFYDYYENVTTFLLEGQYMIGKNILVAHPFSANRNRLQIYLPESVPVWYEFWGGNLYNSSKNNWIDFDIVETDWISFIAQGSVIPLMDNNIINLIIALKCSSQPCEASGELLQAENYLKFTANETSLIISDLPETCSNALGSIRLYYYVNDVGLVNRYNPNIDLCGSGKNYTEIVYEETLDTTTAETTTAETTTTEAVVEDVN